MHFQLKIRVEWLSKKWTSPIYAFFHLIPDIEYVDGCWCPTSLKDTCGAANDIKNMGSITTVFERKGKGKITYSHRQHMKTETK
jgi:hypothetical protein